MKHLLCFLAASLLCLTSGCPPVEPVPDPDPDPVNRAPVASGVTLQTNGDLPYIQEQLVAVDPDGDAVTYELVSADQGNGYDDAVLVPLTGELYVVLEDGFLGNINLNYRATDGRLFSSQATVTVQVTNDVPGDRGTGGEDVAPRDYAEFDAGYFDAVPQVDANGNLIIPTSIDLSPNFPVPGDQGQIGSCVGWAIGYAMKSYQERVENRWDLNNTTRLFSPSYIFNQIALPGCNASYLYEGLQVVVDQGCATWATMPYTDQQGCGTAPGAAARQEAANYRAREWYRVNSIQEAKEALTNRLPVLIGIPIHQNYYNLSGPNAVYNTAVGGNEGGHAVTIVGFDDNRFGGAFKVINSWGTHWGDGGYFWLPYAFGSQVISQMYVLVDKANANAPTPDPVRPEEKDLPNLQVADFDLSYDAVPGGTGLLEYRVVNTGTGTAPTGIDVNLMLSRDTTITNTDTYLLWEQIPFALPPGEFALRSQEQANAAQFALPGTLETGTYYLAFWVDDLDEAKESNETDNVSFAADTLEIANDQERADLVIDTWWAEWDSVGDGALEYTVRNQGAGALTSTQWDLNLILSPNQISGDGDDWFVLHTFPGVTLAPGEAVSDTGLPFNLLTQWNGDPVDAGVYYIGVWVNAVAQVPESDSSNNVSWSPGTIEIVEGKSGHKVGAAGSAHNGRKLPGKAMHITKVAVSYDKDGQVRLEVLEEKAGGDGRVYEKVNGAKDRVVFPVARETAMP